MAPFPGPSRNVAIDTLIAASLHNTRCFTLCSLPLLQTFLVKKNKNRIEIIQINLYRTGWVI